MRYLLACLLALVVSSPVNAESWTWNGSMEWWQSYRGDTQLSLVDDALRLVNNPPYTVTTGVSMELPYRIDISDVLGGSFVYVDTTENISGHGNYLKLEIFDGVNCAVFVSYPYDNRGYSVDLGNNWRRYFFENISQFTSSGPPRLHFSYTKNTILIDNLTIIPEPSSFALIGISLPLVILWRRLCT